MSTTKKIILIVAFLSWTALVVLFSQSFGSNFVTIRIDNQANKIIQSIVVSFETGNLEYSTKAKIPKGERKEIVFPLYGEEGYTILVTFTDGKTLKEGGYSGFMISDPTVEITDSKLLLTKR